MEFHSGHETFYTTPKGSFPVDAGPEGLRICFKILGIESKVVNIGAV